MVFVFGVAPFSNKDGSLEGMRCTMNGGENETFSIVYCSLIGLLAIIIIGSLIGIYLKIGWTIYKHVRVNTNLSNMGVVSPKESRSRDLAFNFEDLSSLDDFAHNEQKNENVTGSTVAIKFEDNIPQKAVDVVGNRVDRHENINKRIIHNITLMFIVDNFYFPGLLHSQGDYYTIGVA